MSMEYVVALKNGVSSPASAAASSTAKLRGELLGTVDAAGKARDAMGRFTGSGGSSGGGLLGAVVGGNLLVGVLSKVAEYAVAAGGALVKAASFRESSLITLETALGNRAAAEAELSDALKIADKTPFDSKEVVTSLTRLATSGLKDMDERRKVFGAITDLAALSGQGSEGLKRGTAAVTQILSKGKLQGEELTGQLAELGLNTGLVYTELAKIYGKTGTEQSQRDAVTKMISKGAVDSRTGVLAITRAIQKMSGGGATGDVAVKLSGTFEGLLSNLTSGFDSLLVRAKVDEWPAMVALKGLLRDIGGSFSEGNATGERFVSIVKSITGGIASVIGVVARVGGAYLGNMFSTAAPAVSALWDVLGRLFGGLSGGASVLDVVVRGFGAMGTAVGYVATVGIRVTTWVLNLLELLQPQRFFQGAVSIGVSIVQGIIEGVGRLGSLLQNKMAGLGDSALQAMKDALGIKSPSEEFAKLGVFSAAGFIEGLNAMMPSVATAAGTLVQAPAVVGGGRGGGSTNNFTFNFSGSPQNPQEFVQQAAPLLRQALNNLLEEQYEEG